MSKSSEPLHKHYEYTTVSGDEVIRDELDRLTRRRSRAIDEELLPESAPTSSDDVSTSLTGLALSGGGIRSGALGLGILQALHRSGLLPFFDYLSTVSGGGYAGAYITSAGSRNRNHVDETTTRSTSHDDTVPYGRLKAFHDGEGLSDRMQQFIFGGHYLVRSRRFFNRYLMGLFSVWLITFSGLSTLAVLAALLFRQLDQPAARHFLSGLGLRTDVSRGLFPVACMLILWFVCWGISFFRAAGNLARAQGKFAAKLIPVVVATFGICVASLLGNGELNLEWLSARKGFDFAALFSSADQFFKMLIYGVIGVGLLPYLNPVALIRSGARPKSASDRVIFAVASRVLLYGLPFLLVSWFAQENISSWTEHRFVPHEVRALGLRDENVGQRNEATHMEVDGTLSGSRDTMVNSNNFVALTRSEIGQWSDWQPAWAPFWARLRAEATRKEAEPKEAERAAADTNTNPPATETQTPAADTNANPPATETQTPAADTNANPPATEIQTPAADTNANPPATEFESPATDGDADPLAAQNNIPFADGTASLPATNLPLAEFVWSELNKRIKGQTEETHRYGQYVFLLPLPDSDIKTKYEKKNFQSVDRVLEFIHVESLALQSLYLRADQNTNDSAPDGPHLIAYRLLSLISLVPDTLQGRGTSNYHGEFVLRRQRLSRVRSWLADHLSRILETADFGTECDWTELGDLKTSKVKTLSAEKKAILESLTRLVEQATLLPRRHNSGTATNGMINSGQASALPILSPAEQRERARMNRAILDAMFPGTLKDPSTIFASNVLAFDQARRWTLFKWCLGLFVVASIVINVNATTLHGFYARELANNWIQSGKDSDLPLSAVDATDQCLPYHILSASVHWTGRRDKAAGDLQRDHFLLSPMYCGCEKTGFVSTARYQENRLGLGDAIAISGAAVSPVQQGNPLLQTLLWLANLRLGQWLPNPNHGTFLTSRHRNLLANIPVTPWRLMLRKFQTAEKRPFLFVTDGGHHENLGIGALLKRRCRFIMAVDAGEDSEYAFTDLSCLMRWARVKHNVKLQPVDSHIDSADQDGDKSQMRSAIDAWNDLAPDNEHRLSADRLSNRHFVMLRIHYPDVDGPSWLVYAKTSLTGDEPAELIRYAESDKKFPHNPTANQFYAPDTFEAYRQLGEHMVESMIAQLPMIIDSRIDEHRGRPEGPYLGGLLHQINSARQTQPLHLSAAPPSPEAMELLQLLRRGKADSETQNRLAKRLTIHPLFVSRLFKAALRSGIRLKPRLMSFLFPELGPESSAARQVFTQRPLPGRTQAMQTFAPREGFNPDGTLVEKLLELAESLAAIPQDTSGSQRERQIDEYNAVYGLLDRIKEHVRAQPHRERIAQLSPSLESPTTTGSKSSTTRSKSRTTRSKSSTTRTRKKTTRRRKPPEKS